MLSLFTFFGTVFYQARPPDFPSQTPTPTTSILSESLVTLQSQESTRRRVFHRMCKHAKSVSGKKLSKKDWGDCIPGTGGHVACRITLKAGTLDYGSAAVLTTHFIS